jgi:uncharacterized damage-inducible protein DinB
MDQKALILGFWDKEGATTRKVISRIPQDRSDYKPDPKARNAREIAWTIVQEEKALGQGLSSGVMDWKDIPTPSDVKEILDTYDKVHAEATKVFHELDAAGWERSIPMMYQGAEVMRATGYENLWGFLFDIIHHRGQLSTYLRPMGSTVPQIYGPTADEP